MGNILFEKDEFAVEGTNEDTTILTTTTAPSPEKGKRSPDLISEVVGAVDKEDEGTATAAPEEEVTRTDDDTPHVLKPREEGNTAVSTTNDTPHASSQFGKQLGAHKFNKTDGAESIETEMFGKEINAGVMASLDKDETMANLKNTLDTLVEEVSEFYE